MARVPVAAGLLLALMAAAWFVPAAADEAWTFDAATDARWRPMERPELSALGYPGGEGWITRHHANAVSAFTTHDSVALHVAYDGMVETLHFVLRQETEGLAAQFPATQGGVPAPDAPDGVFRTRERVFAAPGGAHGEWNAVSMTFEADGAAGGVPPPQFSAAGGGLFLWKAHAAPAPAGDAVLVVRPCIVVDGDLCVEPHGTGTADHVATQRP